MVASREIGWSTEANLYWQISKQLDRIIQLGSLLNPNNDIPEGALTFEGDTDLLTFEDDTEYITFEIELN